MWGAVPIEFSGRMPVSDGSDHFSDASGFIESLDRLSTLDHVTGALEQALARYGVEHLIVVGPPIDGHDFDDLVIASRWPRAFFMLYVDNDYARVDPLEAFALEEGRVFCLQGRRRVLALDAETGDALWQRRAPGSAIPGEDGESGFNPAYHVHGDRVLIQGGGRRWLLHAGTGRLCGQADAPEVWSWPPLPLGPI